MPYSSTSISLLISFGRLGFLYLIVCDPSTSSRTNVLISFLTDASFSEVNLVKLCS
uniref:Uncharacterized protein n=1 Tax=Lepeophtheirus salmonis TaxID=72036 RepID=A0A0K2V8D4_LEPSM